MNESDGKRGFFSRLLRPGGDPTEAEQGGCCGPISIVEEDEGEAAAETPQMPEAAPARDDAPHVKSY